MDVFGKDGRYIMSYADWGVLMMDESDIQGISESVMEYVKHLTDEELAAIVDNAEDDGAVNLRSAELSRMTWGDDDDILEVTDVALHILAPSAAEEMKWRKSLT